MLNGENSEVVSVGCVGITTIEVSIRDYVLWNKNSDRTGLIHWELPAGIIPTILVCCSATNPP